MNTSFTGGDNLYVGLEAGNTNATTMDFILDSSIAGTDGLTVASMYYQYSLGNYDVAVGPLLDNDDLMPTTISKYSDSFFLGGQVLTGAGFYSFPGVTGSGIAVSRIFDSGLNISASIIGTDAANAGGFLTAQGNDVKTLSVGYDADTYGFGLVYVDMDDVCGYVADFETCANLNVAGVAQASSIGLGGYLTPNDGKTTLSLTFNSVDPSIEDFGGDVSDVLDTQVSIDHEWGEGVLSASIKGSEFWNLINNNLEDDYVGEFTEIYYTYPVNDSIEVMGGFSWASGDGKDLEWLERTAVGFGGTFTF